MIALTLILNWIKNHWRLVAYIGGGLLVLILFVTVYQSCKSKPEIKIDQEAINRINSENERVRKEELKKVIEENSDAIDTVDKNNKISEENIESKQKEIDKKVEEAEQKVQEAKQNSGGQITSEQLQCLLVPEDCK